MDRFWIIPIVASVSILVYVDSAYAIHTDEGAHTTPFGYGKIFPPPLKQLKDDVPIQRIACNPEKVLIFKQTTLSPACVSQETWGKLMMPDYGWAKMRIGPPAEPITQEGMCLWYPDVPLVQKNCIDNSIDDFDDYSIQNEIPKQLKGIFENCACQQSLNSFCDQPLINWKNSTHFIDNNLCEFIPLEIVIETTSPFSSVYSVNGTVDSIFYNESSDVIFDVPYTIQGGTVDAMAHDIGANSLLVRIDSDSDGFLTVEIPYQLLTYEEQIACDIFTLVNQEEVEHEISTVRNGNKIVTVNFTDNDPLIEFIGITMPC